MNIKRYEDIEDEDTNTSGDDSFIKAVRKFWRNAFTEEGGWFDGHDTLFSKCFERPGDNQIFFYPKCESKNFWMIYPDNDHLGSHLERAMKLGARCEKEGLKIFHVPINRLDLFVSAPNKNEAVKIVNNVTEMVKKAMSTVEKQLELELV